MIYEPIAEVCNIEWILLPRYVINRSCESLTLELTNVSGSVRTLAKGLMLAHLDPVDMVHDKPVNSSSIFACSVDPGPYQELPEHLQPLVDGAVDLSHTQKQSVSKLLLEYEHCFEGGKYGLGQTSLVKHRIDTGDHAPIKAPPHRLGWAQWHALGEEVDKMLGSVTAHGPLHQCWWGRRIQLSFLCWL